MSIKEAMLRAYEAAGKRPPEVNERDAKKVVVARGTKGKSQTVVVQYGRSSGGRASRSKEGGNVAGEGQTKTVAGVASVSSVSSNSYAQARSVKLVSAASTTQSSINQSGIEMKQSRPKAQNYLGSNAQCMVSLSETKQWQLIDLDMEVGCKDSIHQLVNPEVHEMSLGLDFGTSSVKVVIGDLSSDKAYAVPFLEEDGIDSYLLPSRVFESIADERSGGGFNLSRGEIAFRDLKLRLLGNPERVDCQVEVIAFLALVIQRCRAWLFQVHKAVYKRVKCLWQLRIGLPAATAIGNKYVPMLEQLLRVAWEVAAMPTGIDRAYVQAVRDRILRSELGANEPDVKAIPEIAAQIFGFVVSYSFDNKAANRYLMVDVGAGTVDSSLFRVFPGRGGRWNFEFYTAVVQPYGVSNLHVNRVDWWCEKLNEIEHAERLREEIAETKFATDLGVTVPSHNRDYFKDVYFSNENPDHTDHVFFEKLMSQVQGSTMWRAWKNGFLEQSHLTHTPMFLCGGGARSSYYLELENKLRHTPSFSWLSAVPWQLAHPSDLMADDIDEVDFDRLSVAYGLSKLNVGSIDQAIPLPIVQPEVPKPFTDRYIDKDQT